MDNKLVHVLRCIRESETGDPVAPGLGCAEGDVEEGDVRRGENCEVIGHFGCSSVCPSVCYTLDGRGRLRATIYLWLSGNRR